MVPENCLVGFHAPIRGGIEQAPGRIKELGCTTGQIFTKNSRQWKAREFREGEVEQFVENARTLPGPVVAHTGYLINLGNPEAEKWEKSLDALEVELRRAAALEIVDVVLHPGLHVGSGEAAGMKRIETGLNRVLEATKNLSTDICLENTAGQGSSLGYDLEQLATWKERVERPERITFCLDTCHLHGAGYALDTEAGYAKTVEEIAAVLGTENVRAIHLNDARHPRDSRKDRHAHIGEGEIGETGFRLLMQDNRWAETPKILETPVEDDWRQAHRKNLEKLVGYLD